MVLDYTGTVSTIAGVSVLVSGEALSAWLIAASMSLIFVSGVDQVVLFVKPN